MFCVWGDRVSPEAGGLGEFRRERGQEPADPTACLTDLLPGEAPPLDDLEHVAVDVEGVEGVLPK